MVNPHEKHVKKELLIKALVKIIGEGKGSPLKPDMAYMEKLAKDLHHNNIETLESILQKCQELEKKLSVAGSAI